MAPTQTTVPSTDAMPCPCGASPALRYTDCCGRYHRGDSQGQAPTPERLMRSRYSAFVLNLTDYLLATWHPSTRPASLQPQPGLSWLGLEVRRHHLLDDTHGVVEFVARSKILGKAHRHHEISRFVKEQGRWFYIDGDQ